MDIIDGNSIPRKITPYCRIIRDLGSLYHTMHPSRICTYTDAQCTFWQRDEADVTTVYTAIHEIIRDGCKFQEVVTLRLYICVYFHQALLPALFMSRVTLRENHLLAALLVYVHVFLSCYYAFLFPTFPFPPPPPALSFTFVRCFTTESV